MALAVERYGLRIWGPACEQPRYYSPRPSPMSSGFVPSIPAWMNEGTKLLRWMHDLAAPCGRGSHVLPMRLRMLGESLEVQSLYIHTYIHGLQGFTHAQTNSMGLVTRWLCGGVPCLVSLPRLAVWHLALGTRTAEVNNQTN